MSKPTFTLTKEITIDDLPKEMLSEIELTVVKNSLIYASKGKFDIFCKYYDDQRDGGLKKNSNTISVLDIVNDLEDYPYEAEHLITELEKALVRLKEIAGRQ